ncbi:formate--tetrahydrofolate ligase [Ramlibacter sp.]|uniref:formate--tetrahydrofolate ligase n=1 Tax=Ramlibacter sp. TaxID=1917967 RepID=UPI002C09AF15|nr:formate--tetrahydrofolate ligase [Ramlibacter sp.]HWI81695.1 formate--tetrahydrofolate ligase [Ramlibacter sp.]
MLPIKEIADSLGIAEEHLHHYGKYTAKLSLDLLKDSGPRRGKLILVTAVTPTAHGEGKTVVSIGLAQAIARSGRKAIATLREPSLGPVFGVKGGATGGGQSRVLPSEQINLHFNGDIHAVTSAHNLLAAAIDSHIHHGNRLRIDVDNIWWPRTIDMNDRALRHVVVGLGGKANGVPRESRFVITAASELMAILALADSRQDLRRRLDDIVIGLDLDGRIVRAGAIGATGGMLVLLNEAIMPNLVQTTEHTPALVHAGPFANIAHGTSSVISQQIALRLADYVVNEAGFGADLGAEKYFDLVMPSCGIRPACTVLIATARALAHQGAPATGPAASAAQDVRRGLPHLARHIENLRKFKVPVVVAINRFPSDTEQELRIIRDFCAERGVACAAIDVFGQGGAGALELAAKAMAAADATDPDQARPLYGRELTLEQKIETVAREIYGAQGIYFEAAARKKLALFAAAGFGYLPVCMAKTQSSLSDNPALRNVPTGWTLTVSDAFLSAGAGFVVVVAGTMLLMPGLPRVSQAAKMDVDDDGNIIGLG